MENPSTPGGSVQRASGRRIREIPRVRNWYGASARGMDQASAVLYRAWPERLSERRHAGGFGPLSGRIACVRRAGCECLRMALTGVASLDVVVTRLQVVHRLWSLNHKSHTG